MWSAIFFYLFGKQCIEEEENKKWHIRAIQYLDSKNKQSSYSQLGREREREKEIYKYRSTISKLTKKHL